jgi:hypothetical protein
LGIVQEGINSLISSSVSPHFWIEPPKFNNFNKITPKNLIKIRGKGEKKLNREINPKTNLISKEWGLIWFPVS